MATKEMTKLYDLYLSYENGYDDEPRLYVYEVYKTSEGWQAEHQPSYNYYFDELDKQWLVEQGDLDSISDYWVDEWFTTEDRGHVTNNLPPKVISWLDALPEYEYEEEI
jgi:hypothetical protein